MDNRAILRRLMSGASPEAVRARYCDANGVPRQGRPPRHALALIDAMAAGQTVRRNERAWRLSRTPDGPNVLYVAPSTLQRAESYGWIERAIGEYRLTERGRLAAEAE